MTSRSLEVRLVFGMRRSPRKLGLLVLKTTSLMNNIYLGGITMGITGIKWSKVNREKHITRYDYILLLVGILLCLYIVFVTHG